VVSVTLGGPCTVRYKVTFTLSAPTSAALSERLWDRRQVVTDFKKR